MADLLGAGGWPSFTPPLSLTASQHIADPLAEQNDVLSAQLAACLACGNATLIAAVNQNTPCDICMHHQKEQSISFVHTADRSCFACYCNFCDQCADHTRQLYHWDYRSVEKDQLEDYLRRRVEYNLKRFNEEQSTQQGLFVQPDTQQHQQLQQQQQQEQQPGRKRQRQIHEQEQTLQVQQSQPADDPPPPPPGLAQPSHQQQAQSMPDLRNQFTNPKAQSDHTKQFHEITANDKGLVVEITQNPKKPNTRENFKFAFDDGALDTKKKECNVSHSTKVKLLIVNKSGRDLFVTPTLEFNEEHAAVCLKRDPCTVVLKSNEAFGRQTVFIRDKEQFCFVMFFLPDPFYDRETIKGHVEMWKLWIRLGDGTSMRVMKAYKKPIRPQRNAGKKA